MNTARSTLLFVFCIASTNTFTMETSEQEASQQTLNEEIQTTRTLPELWHNKWFKLGCATTACTIAYTIAAHYHLVPSPASTIPLFVAAGVTAKTMTNDPQKNDSANMKLTTESAREVNDTPSEVTIDTERPFIFSSPEITTAFNKVVDRTILFYTQLKKSLKEYNPTIDQEN